MTNLLTKYRFTSFVLACLFIYLMHDVISAQGIFDPTSNPIDLGTGTTGILAVSKGGTSLSSIAVNSIIVGNGTSTPNQITGIADQVLRIPADGGATTFGTVDLSKAAAITGNLSVGNGGTGLGGTPSNGQIPIGNGTGYTLTGVTGTTNQITVTNGVGTITLSMPQNIHSGATPTFAGETLTGSQTATLYISTKQTITVADDAIPASPALVTITPVSTYIEVTCNDADGCNATMGEGGISAGSLIFIVNISANALNFADTPGISELAGAFAEGQYDSISMVYATDRWVELNRSNN